MRLGGCVVLGLLVLTSACGDDTDTGAGGQGGEGGQGGQDPGNGGGGGAPISPLRPNAGIDDCAAELLGEDGRCRPVASACDPGTKPNVSVGCEPVGVTSCSETFTDAGGVCAPAVDVCPAGSLIIPSLGASASVATSDLSGNAGETNWTRATWPCPRTRSPPTLEAVLCPHCLDTITQSPYREAASAKPARRQLEREAHPVGIELDRCPACMGVFLDHGELEKLENSARGKAGKRPSAIDFVRRAFERGRVAGAEAEPEREALDCPKCSDVMFEREWSIGTMVHVDVCLDCRGVWLDPGELDTLESIFGAVG